MEDPTQAHKMTTAELRGIRDTFPPLLTYSAVVALGVDLFGMTPHMMRKQLEHRPSAIPAVKQPGKGAARYRLADAVELLVPNPYFCKDCWDFHAGPC